MRLVICPISKDSIALREHPYDGKRYLSPIGRLVRSREKARIFTGKHRTEEAIYFAHKNNFEVQDLEE